jgi:hypothetical protein
MLGQTRIAAHPTHLGQLLVASNIINNESLCQALHVAKGTQLPLGRVLSMSGKLREEDLPGLLQAQKLARQGWIPVESMVTVLRDAHYHGVAYDEALLRQGWVKMSANPQTCFAPEAGDEEPQDVPPPASPMRKRAPRQPTQEDCLDTLHLLQDACLALTVDEIGPLDPVLFDLALRCQEMISENFVARKTAMAALAYYANSRKLKKAPDLCQGLGIRNLVNRVTGARNGGLAATA